MRERTQCYFPSKEGIHFTHFSLGKIISLDIDISLYITYQKSKFKLFLKDIISTYILLQKSKVEDGKYSLYVFAQHNVSQGKCICHFDKDQSVFRDLLFFLDNSDFSYFPSFLTLFCKFRLEYIIKCPENSNGIGYWGYEEVT